MNTKENNKQPKIMNLISFDNIPSDENAPAFIRIMNIFVIFSFIGLLIHEYSRYIPKNSTDSSNIFWLFFFFAILLFFIVISVAKIIYFFKENKYYSISSIALIALMVIYYYFKNGQSFVAFLSSPNTFLVLSLLIVSSYGIPFDRINKVYFLTTLLFFVIKIIGYYTNLLPGTVIVSSNLARVGNTMGFGHYNTVLTFVFGITVSWIYIIRSHKKYIIDSIIIMLVSSVFLFITTSRTRSLLLILAAVFLLFLSIDFPDNFKSIRTFIINIFRIIALLSPAFLLIITFFCMYIFDYYKYVLHAGEKVKANTFWIRFYMFEADLSKHGIIFPGLHITPSKKTSPFNWFVGDAPLSKYSDNLIHNTFINYGIIITIVLLILFQLWAVYAYNKKNDIILLIILLIATSSIMESSATAYMANPFLLLMFTHRSSPEEELSHKQRSFKELIKQSVSILRMHKAFVFALSLIYVFITLYFSTVIAYQVMTKTVTSFFFVWIVLTIIYSNIILLIIDKNYYSDISFEEVSIKGSARKYSMPVTLSCILFIIGAVIMTIYIFRTTTYDINLFDPRIAQGVQLESKSLRQVFKAPSSGFQQIDIYLNEYSDNLATMPINITRAGRESIEEMAVVINPGDYKKEQKITIDTSTASVAKGDVVAVTYYKVDTGDSSLAVPVIKKITYTFIKDISVLYCILIELPVIISIIIIWIVFARRVQGNKSNKEQN